MSLFRLSGNVFVDEFDQIYNSTYILTLAWWIHIHIWKKIY